MFISSINRETLFKIGGKKMKKMLKTVMKWAPILYPIGKKLLNKRKSKKNLERRAY